MAKQKLVIQVNMHCEKRRAKALTVVVQFYGVISATLDVEKDQITIVGEGVDSVCLVAKLRKKMGCGELVSVGPEKPPEKEEDPKEKLKKECEEKCKKKCEEKCKKQCECKCEKECCCRKGCDEKCQKECCKKKCQKDCKKDCCKNSEDICKKIEYCPIQQGCYNPPPPYPYMCQVYEEPCYGPSCYIM